MISDHHKEQLIRLIFPVLLAGFTFAGNRNIVAQPENLKLIDKYLKGASAGVMQMNHLNEEASIYYDLRDAEISKLTTGSEWIKRQEYVKSVLGEIVGPFPPRTPLNPRITGILKKDGYRVEKIIIESIPGYYVTGCMFIPDGIKGKRPAILDAIGHSEGSFRKESYQNVIHNLVRKGFIVFAIDPVGQAEKEDYYDPLTKKSVVEEGEDSHCYFGNQCFISGFSVIKYFIWDGIRAIDYLCSRKEVDPERIGVTGLSGGGTVTSFLCAFDERIKAAAPYNWAVYDRWLMETHGEQGAETYIYHGLLHGITFADLLEARAPKPTLMIKTTRDYLPIQAAREAYSEIMKAYKAFGKEEYLELIEDDAEHQFTRKNNEATYAFFQKYLDLPGDPAEAEAEMISREELKVSPTGRVSTYFSDAETISSLNKKETEPLIRNLVESRKDIRAHLEKVRQKSIELSGYKAPDNDLKPLFNGRYKRDGYSVEKYLLAGEGSCFIPLLLFVPDGKKEFSSLIYLHPEGKEAQSATGGQIEELVKKGYIVAAPDLFGVGETKNQFRSYQPVIMDYCAFLIGRSTTGIQAGDVSRVINYLKSRDDVVKEKIGAVAVGQMGPVLLHAAVFDSSIKHAVLVGSPLSYKSIVFNKYYEVSLSCTVAGALKAYDLPDLIACLAPMKIVLAGCKDHMMNPAGEGLIRQELEFPSLVYSDKGVADNMKVLVTVEDIPSLVSWSMN